MNGRLVLETKEKILSAVPRIFLPKGSADEVCEKTYTGVLQAARVDAKICNRNLVYTLAFSVHGNDTEQF